MSEPLVIHHTFDLMPGQSPPSGSVVVNDGPSGNRLGEASEWVEVSPGVWQCEIVIDEEARINLMEDLSRLSVSIDPGTPIEEPSS